MPDSPETDHNPNYPMPEENEGVPIEYDPTNYAGMSAAIELANLMGEIATRPKEARVYTLRLKVDACGKVRLSADMI